MLSFGFNHAFLITWWLHHRTYGIDYRKTTTIEEFLRIHQNCTDHEIVEYTRERWSTKYANYNFNVL
ncbi:hypothetical protein T07_12058 [Trichinella nelsoni]|uniref:Uncharacterized protein n=1 Tax=Trichinella nelsoni TaxID=6336 RepID=A0A0V0S3X2_9BILA|nr:hypothetical protein T07_12058 [Trichinella nelsoni]